MYIIASLLFESTSHLRYIICCKYFTYSINNILNMTGFINFMYLIRYGVWLISVIKSDIKPDNAEDIRPCLTVGGSVSEHERVDGQGTSLAIMSATRFAALFPVFSLVMLTMAVILGIIGNLKQDVRTLLASVISVIAGSYTYIIYTIATTVRIIYIHYIHYSHDGQDHIHIL
ncbi:hypothetical protein ACJMK2_033682 [Sinanodonta woodiana]|uniref:Uncharacterized protein n=1 Tax=Sinanodonta woodiana TaxID=1069815 RepID=A0ABD3WP68_SINWO